MAQLIYKYCTEVHLLFIVQYTGIALYITSLQLGLKVVENNHIGLDWLIMYVTKIK